MKIYKIYTDGSTKGNGKKFSFGGWAYAIYNDKKELILSNSGAETDTTNNKMEMMAILKGVEAIKTLLLDDIKLNEEDLIEICTDSAYIYNCYKDKWYINWKKNGWVNSAKKPVKNKELWEELIPYFNNDKFIFTKVKGHADSEENNLVDQMAVAASTKLQQRFVLW